MLSHELQHNLCSLSGTLEENIICVTTDDLLFFPCCFSHLHNQEKDLCHPFYMQPFFQGIMMLCSKDFILSQCKQIYR